MGTMQIENSRRNPRQRVHSMTVRYRTATLGKFIEEHSFDISTGGTFVETTAPCPPGTLLKFELQVEKEQRAMHGVGRVVWSRDTTGDRKETPVGMGIKFIKIDEGTQSMIDRLVQAQNENAPSSGSDSPAAPPTTPKASKSILGRFTAAFTRS